MTGGLPGFRAPFADASVQEGGAVFAPKFNAEGLLTAVAQDAASGAILMVAHMNAEALAKTIETGQAWYWSRSRAALWRKGESSGHTQTVLEIGVDCDQDALVLRVEQVGPACHTGARSCFYRRLADGRLESMG